ncbi:MAG: response regulator [Proteobacteria bacterium]|nr:response regulator [Pseudomonadota bacterium]MBU1059138.1 response regulator [Pseudomonadota bacterium]
MIKNAGTILIAEDDPLVRKTMGHYLTANGFIVLEASNGSAALEIFREKKPDLLLTDLRMPKLDGMLLIQAVVKEDPHIPVIIFSGMGTMSDVIEALRAGAWDYLTKPITDLDILGHSINKALERVGLLHQEKRYQASLEKEVQKRTLELQQQNSRLEQEMKERQIQEALVLQAKQEWERTVDAMPDMIAIIDIEHSIVRMNKTMLDQLGKSYNEVLGTKCFLCVHDREESPDYCPHSKLLEDGRSHRVEIYEERLGGHCEISVTPYYDPDGSLLGSVHIARNINEQKIAAREKEKLQSQLLHAQKLESVGQLAAGIAHEINTPIQFIGTNIAFLDEADQDISDFMTQIQEIAKRAPQKINAAMDKALEELDWAYLAEEIPLAIKQSYEGVKRVRSIIQAMKEFSHPGSKNKELLDLNRIINTTVTVARNEWKYVADMELDLDPELPKVPLLADEMGQVVLNMLVNAAHAIAENLDNKRAADKGRITITTRKTRTGVELRIQDTGIGMPKEVQRRIFDPFYTTKKVGKGTGQGLAISHDVIVDKHQGTIEVESTVTEGTTFIIQLPLQDGETQ